VADGKFVGVPSDAVIDTVEVCFVCVGEIMLVSVVDFDAENDTESLAVVNEELFTMDAVCVRP
jgi:hypothetical protein